MSTAAVGSQAEEASPHVWRRETSSLSADTASIRYNLSEDDEQPILAYDWNGELAVTTQRNLCQRIAHEDTKTPLRVTKKPIPRFQKCIEVKRHDLYLGEREHTAFRAYPNYDSSLASITLPSAVYWRRATSSNAYTQLYIVSPEASPDSSGASSLVAGHVATDGAGGPMTRGGPDAQSESERQ